MTDAGQRVGAELLTRVRAEIDGRLAELRPAVAEYERLTGASEALDTERRAPKRAARGSSTRGSFARRPSPAPSADQHAIVAALEHGSHTVGELVLVTALPGTSIRAALKPLLKSGAVTRAKREGRLAYALSSTA
jgi:hypothetical protein